MFLIFRPVWIGGINPAFINNIKDWIGGFFDFLFDEFYGFFLLVCFDQTVEVTTITEFIFGIGFNDIF